MSATTQITDEQLHIKLVSSYLDFNQVLIISPLIPILNAEQRQELLKLIDESEKLNSQSLAADATYDEGLSELNQEYTKKMDQLVTEETKYARKEYEKLGSQNDAQQLTQMEDEISVL
jgi:Cft2 family RNA processing exonuclease